MNKTSEQNRKLINEDATTEITQDRAPYERPTLTKRRSVRKVVLFSGSGVTGGSALTGGG